MLKVMFEVMPWLLAGPSLSSLELQSKEMPCLSGAQLKVQPGGTLRGDNVSLSGSLGGVVSSVVKEGRTKRLRQP